MTEYRIVTFTQPVTALAAPPGQAKSLTIDFLSSVPELAENMDGWEVINSQIVPAGENVILTFFLKTDLDV
ncbi:hypothetical protein ACIFOC_00381 [Leucobacter aridicollis]|uniref:hypothetical protein n=1 Tax=Leucobacter aridicollis TaxID=283878 RepID=UPI0037C81E77